MIEAMIKIQYYPKVHDTVEPVISGTVISDHPALKWSRDTVPKIS